MPYELKTRHEIKKTHAWYKQWMLEEGLSDESSSESPLSSATSSDTEQDPICWPARSLCMFSDFVMLTLPFSIGSSLIVLAKCRSTQSRFASAAIPVVGRFQQCRKSWPLKMASLAPERRVSRSPNRKKRELQPSQRQRQRQMQSKRKSPRHSDLANLSHTRDSRNTFHKSNTIIPGDRI